MKTWYIAVCDKCGLARNVIVTGPVHTIHYLEQDNKIISDFLIEHAGYGHSEGGLRLIYDDRDLDTLFESGYARATEDDATIQKLYELKHSDQSEYKHFIENLYVRSDQPKAPPK